MLSIIPNRSIIKISGIDAEKFLQNLVTNDVTINADSIYAMMLSPQGRFLFDMFIVRTEEGYLLDVLAGTKDLLLKKLNMYKINMQVAIEDIAELGVWYSNNYFIQNGTIKCYQDPRYTKLGYRCLSFIGEIVNDDVESYLMDKYMHTIPDGGIDLLFDKAMPQEYGAEQLQAISYKKGCYVGQEVISRTKSQGVVRKKIYKVTAHFDLSTITHGTEIFLDEIKVGIFCSGYSKEGIALIREGEAGEIEDDIYSINGNEVRLSRAKWY